MFHFIVWLLRDNLIETYYTAFIRAVIIFTVVCDMEIMNLAKKTGLTGALLAAILVLIAIYALPTVFASSPSPQYIKSPSNFNCSSIAVGSGCGLNESCSPSICVYLTTQVDSSSPSNEGLCAGYTTNGQQVTCNQFCGAGSGSTYYYSGTGTVDSAYLNVGTQYNSNCGSQTASYSNTDTVYSNG